MWMNRLKHSFFISFFAPCYLDKFCVQLTFLSWSHFHLFSFIPCLLLPTAFTISRNDILTHCDCTWCPDSMPEAEFSKNIIITIEQCPSHSAYSQPSNSLRQNEIHRRLGMWTICFFSVAIFRMLFYSFHSFIL